MADNVNPIIFIFFILQEKKEAVRICVCAYKVLFLFLRGFVWIYAPGLNVICFCFERFNNYYWGFFGGGVHEKECKNRVREQSLTFMQ